MPDILQHHLIRYILGELPEEQTKAIDDLISSNAEVARQYYSLKDAWEKSGIIFDIQQLDVDREWEEFSQKIRKPKCRTVVPRNLSVDFIIKFSIAASLLLLLGLTFLFTFHSSTKQSGTNLSDEKRTEFSVQKGQKGFFILTDGTKVWLNSQSKISYSSSYDSISRDIILVGEAYFEVVHNPSKPFHVITKDITVEVLGTTFNISAYPDEKRTEAALLSGKLSLVNNAGNKKVYLKPNEAASVFTESTDIHKEIFSTDVYSLWRNGEYVFVNEPIENVLTKLERNFNKEFVFDKKIIEGKRLTAHFKKGESLSKILHITGNALEIKFIQNKDRIHVIKHRASHLHAEQDTIKHNLTK
jgi:transmembrane sensor